MNLRKLANISIKYPKVIILIWLLFFIIFGFSAPKLPTVLKDHGLIPDGESTIVQHTMSTDFHIPEDPVILVFEKKESVSDENFRWFIQKTLFQLKGIDGLTQMVSPLQREGMTNGNFAYALLAFKQKTYEMTPVLDEIQRRLPMNTEISVKLTGKSVVQTDVNRASQTDLIKAERIGIIAAFIILWLAFGGAISAMIPIIIGVIGVTGTMGIMYWMNTEVEWSNFVLNVIPMVGLALSIDFALMLVSRFREELERKPAEKALVITMETAGRAVLFSALSVLLGLMGILFIPLPMFFTITLGAMMVLTVSVLLSLTLVPALLYVLRPVILAENKSFYRLKKWNFWSVISLYVMRRPVHLGLLAAFLISICILPLNKMELVIPDATSLPKDYNSRLAFETYQTHFVSPTNSEVYIVAHGKTDSLKKDDWLNAYALIQRLESDPEVQKVDSVFSNLRMPPEQLASIFQKPILKKNYKPFLQHFVKGNKILIHVTVKGEPSSYNVMSWLRHWEQEGELSTIPFMLGGEPKYQQEVFDDVFQNIKYVLFFIIVSNYVVLFIAFRSVLVPLKTIVMNLLSLGASFGILVWVFKEGNFGIEPNKIAIMIPVFIFGLVFGISMDYGVFLVSRIFEEYKKTRDNNQAVLVGLSSISRIINSAAAIMISVTLPFAFGDVIGVKQLGIGIAAAIFIDATVIRMVLVPSLMKMMGKWNWWAPGWLK